MDSIYAAYNKNASKQVNLKQYFSEYKTLLTPYQNKMMKGQQKESVLSLMNANLTDEEMDMLIEYCSTDNLTVPGEIPKRINDKRVIRQKLDPSGAPDDVSSIDLKTVQNLKKSNSVPNPKLTLKYASEFLISYEPERSENKLAEPGKDMLVYFRIYEPFIAHSDDRVYKQIREKVKVSSVIAILGRQTLAQLRDQIKCVSDLSISVDVSQNPDVPLGPAAKDIYKSGFFFIENTFYNDFRDPTNKDNSKVIIDWAKARNLGTFKTASMADTTVDSLCTKFGFPWVYQHQGSCEHLLVLSDARLIMRDDELVISAYPRIHRIRQHGAKYCMMCGMYPARWITTDSDRAPHNPCYFCDNCFKSYNYIDGKKIGSFKAYSYPCDPELMRFVQRKKQDSTDTSSNSDTE